MSQDLNRDLLIALKALLYVRDHSSRMSYAVTIPVEEFARDAIERAEFRTPKKTVSYNGVPAGWYDDVYNERSPEPLALLAAANEENGKPEILSALRMTPANLDEYISGTALANEGPAASPATPKP